MMQVCQNNRRATQHKYSAITLWCLGWIFLSLLSPLQTFGRDETKEQKIERLRLELKVNDEARQRSAIAELAGLGEDAIPVLIENLKTNQKPKVLDDTARALSIIGNDSLPVLVQTLKDEIAGAKNTKVLRYTANAIKLIAAKSKGTTPIFAEAVTPLMEVLKNKKGLESQGASKDELQDFDAAADCLQYLGKDAKEAVPLLIELLIYEKNRKEDLDGFYRKRDAIVAIIDDLINQADFSANEKIIAAFDKYREGILDQDRVLLEKKVTSLRIAKELQDYQRSSLLRNIMTEHRTLVQAAIIISLIFLGWLSIFLLKPIWLLKIYKLFSISETRLSGILGVITVSAQHLLALVILRPRVLDAWVKKQLPKAYRGFLNKQTVKDRRVYVPVGLFLNDQLISEFSAAEVEETFNRNQSRLLIAGVGGAGKTSLACQLARWAMSQKKDERLSLKHAMLPVLLEQDFVEGGEDALQKAICAQLSDLIDADTTISNALLQALLEKKRVLVLIDGMSEMNDATRNAILSGLTTIPVNAVIFTSRSDETISELSKTIIKPTTIKGNQLSSFVERYLTSLGQKELFEDEEFFESCRLLSTIVNDRDITVLLAKLFVEQMIAKQKKIIEGELPKNIPELMLQSIEVLHAHTPAEELTLRDVIKAAKVIAWECLKKDYRPLPADYEEVLTALSSLPNGEKSLNYLKNRLKLIEMTSHDEKIRFKIDPLAEYLAGMCLVEGNKYNQQKWHKFFDNALSKDGAPQNINGFLLAVRDCCMQERAKLEVPVFVFEALTKLTRTDPKGKGERTGVAEE